MSELQSRQDLHSFPTRRSSDLRRVRDGACRSSPRRRVAGPERVGRSQPGASRAAPASLDGGRCMGADGSRGFGGGLLRPHRDADTAGRLEDRKSTCLNSSHAKIFTLSLHDALPICAAFATGRADPRLVVEWLRRSAWAGRSQAPVELPLLRWMVADAWEQMGHADSAAAYFALIVTPTRQDGW